MTPGARHRRERDNQCSLSVLILWIVGWGVLYGGVLQEQVPSLSGAVVRTAASIGMHRAREALADQSTARFRSRKVFRDGWQACIEAAAVADAALAAGRILPAGNNFIVVIFVTM